jgi:hypothetical protein
LIFKKLPHNHSFVFLKSNKEFLFRSQQQLSSTLEMREDYEERFEKMNLHPKEKKGKRTGASLSFTPSSIFNRNHHCLIDTIFVFEEGTAIPVRRPLGLELEVSVDNGKRWNREDIEEDETGPDLVLDLTRTPDSRENVGWALESAAVNFRKELLKKLGKDNDSSESQTQNKVRQVKGRKGRTLKQKREKGKKGCRRETTSPQEDSGEDKEDKEREEEEDLRNLKVKIASNQVHVRAYFTNEYVKKLGAKSETKGATLRDFDRRNEATCRLKRQQEVLNNAFV